jgi:hypothetical protein
MSQQQYSGLDRFLHKLVLGSKVIQSTSFELQQLIAPKLPQPDRPVFVVGMARSGTTTLLNLLFATGEFESSRYRDLPLPLFPAFWRKVHKGFHQGQSPIQRVHDDGILVSPDSPEAFEESASVQLGRGSYNRGPGSVTLFQPHLEIHLNLQDAPRGACIKPCLDHLPSNPKPKQLSKRFLRCLRPPPSCGGHPPTHSTGNNVESIFLKCSVTTKDQSITSWLQNRETSNRNMSSRSKHVKACSVLW